MRAVNLLPRDEAKRSFAANRGVVFGGVGGAALATAVLASMMISAGGAASSKQNELDAIRAQIAAVPRVPVIDTSEEDALAAEKGARIGALSAALGGRIAWDRVLRQVSLVLPEDVWLSNWSATTPTPASGATAPSAAAGQPPTLMTLEGYTYSHESVARLLTRLSVIPDLRNVWLTKSSRGALAGRTIVSFTILADVRAAGATSS